MVGPRSDLVNEASASATAPAGLPSLFSRSASGRQPGSGELTVPWVSVLSVSTVKPAGMSAGVKRRALMSPALRTVAVGFGFGAPLEPPPPQPAARSTAEITAIDRTRAIR